MEDYCHKSSKLTNIMTNKGKLTMGEDSKKSFWTSLPGILTGIASVIGVIITLFTTLHLIPTSSNTNITSPTSSTPITPSTIPTSTNQLPDACGSKLLGINIFGKWNWFGTNNGYRQSGSTTFKNDCTYTSIATYGLTVNTNGHFSISSSPTTTIKLQNNLGREQTYLVNKIHEDSFHMNDLNNIVNLDFIRTP